MRGKLSAMLVTAATATLLAGGATGASAAAGDKAATAAKDSFGCPSGYVCLIATDATTITDKFYTYGAHNLSNKYGLYWVDNNQTGGATADLCYGYNGGNCTGGRLAAGQYDLFNLTPINSIRLNRP